MSFAVIPLDELNLL